MTNTAIATSYFNAAPPNHPGTFSQPSSLELTVSNSLPDSASWALENFLLSCVSFPQSSQPAPQPEHGPHLVYGLPRGGRKGVAGLHFWWEGRKEEEKLEQQLLPLPILRGDPDLISRPPPCGHPPPGLYFLLLGSSPESPTLRQVCFSFRMWSM